MKRTLQIRNELESEGVLDRTRLYELSGRRASAPWPGREVEAMDTLKPEIARLFAAKDARRRRLATLPFPEKVGAVVRLQEMAALVLRARGRKVRVWNLDGRVE